MLSFPDILKSLEDEVCRINLDYSPKNLFTPIEYILALGGKRIRPALTIAACNLYSDNITPAIKPALSLEVFHNFTLLHDDLMDEADKRRNRPTVHKKWGANAAILSGDAMLIVAYKLIGETHSSYLKEFLDLFSQTALEICCGQQYDMEFESRTDVTEEEYIEMIRLKTAVLLACGMKMGALAGGSSLKDADHLYLYGINLGLAFQLKDDLLDTYGDPETFGKNIGGDIVCNKKTFLLVTALKHATEKQKLHLYEWFKKKNFDPENKINAFKEIYDELNAKEICENNIRAFYKKADQELEYLSVAPERLSILREIGSSLMDRNK